MFRCEEVERLFFHKTDIIFLALYCVRGQKKREEKLCEMKTVDAAGKAEASLSEPNKEKSSACQFVTADGEWWQPSRR